MLILDPLWVTDVVVGQVTDSLSSGNVMVVVPE
jgi:hypothetical protein